jgi:hypothetical protein
MTHALQNKDPAIVHGGAVCAHVPLTERDTGTLCEQKSSLAERSWKNTPRSRCGDVGYFRGVMKIVKCPMLQASSGTIDDSQLQENLHGRKRR